MSRTGKRPNNQLTTSTLYLTSDEIKLVKMAKAQFERRGGWVRIFPTADSWLRYSQYLDQSTGIPMSVLPNSSQTSLNVGHNYNLLLHNHLFAHNLKNSSGSSGSDSSRHDRYERQLSQGHRGGNLDHGRDRIWENSEDLKKQIIGMLRSGRTLT